MNIPHQMVIASGRSTRQVASMATKLAEKIKERRGSSPRLEGVPAADPVPIVAADVLLPLFWPQVRSFYNLERMWAFGDDAPAPRSAGAAPGA